MVVETHFIFALVIALSLSCIFAFFLHRQMPRTGFFLFFLIIFLFTLVGGLWIKPFGPVGFGVFWLPMLLAGLLGAIFLYYRAPRPPPRNRTETIDLLEKERQRQEMERMTFLTIDLLFWIIFVLLTGAIVLYFIKEGNLI